jgi:ATP-dependent DNA helicase PIF1
MDEYSMISSLQLFWASDRVKQGVCNNDKEFGGVPTILFGDPGQLPPVGGTQLWVKATSSGRALSILAQQGHALYKKIETVMWLTHVRRQKGQFQGFLQRLRDGLNDESDWKYLNDQCSIDVMTPDRISSFQNEDTIFLYSTNEACTNMNTERLIATGAPIAQITAKHDSAKSATKSSDSCRNLQRHIYLCVGARVMLMWNVSLPLGLVNGSSGIVIDFVYKNDERPPDLPSYIIVDFKDYIGRPFFEGVERQKWVPLKPEIVEWTSAGKSKHYRQQFPIILSWALTTWKAQGMTCRGKVYAPFADIERQGGLSYVNLSRLTDVRNLCIGKAVTLDRITTKISNSKGMQTRLLEDARLRSLWTSTRSFFDT